MYQCLLIEKPGRSAYNPVRPNTSSVYLKVVFLFFFFFPLIFSQFLIGSRPFCSSSAGTIVLLNLEECILTWQVTCRPLVIPYSPSMCCEDNFKTPVLLIRTCTALSSFHNQSVIPSFDTGHFQTCCDFGMTVKVS